MTTSYFLSVSMDWWETTWEFLKMQWKCSFHMCNHSYRLVAFSFNFFIIFLPVNLLAVYHAKDSHLGSMHNQTCLAVSVFSLFNSHVEDLLEFFWVSWHLFPKFSWLKISGTQQLIAFLENLFKMPWDLRLSFHLDWKSLVACHFVDDITQNYFML